MFLSGPEFEDQADTRLLWRWATDNRLGLTAVPFEYGSTPVARLTAIGGLPEVVRRRFDIPWTLADQLQYRAMVIAVREGSRIVPTPVQRVSMRRLARQSVIEPAA